MNSIFHPLVATSVAETSAYQVVAELVAAGHQAFTVGGAVRDRLLSRRPEDVDVTTSAAPAQVMAIFPRTVAVGAAFGVVVVVTDEAQTEVATFREESGYSDGRRPDQVSYSDPAHDALRRDFTINALFYDPASEEIHDYVGGYDDLHSGVVRAIGKPAERFAEDYLRMLRAIRFSAQLQFELDAETRAGVAASANQIGKVSQERIFAEMEKMLLSRDPGLALEGLLDVGLLQEILPEVAAMPAVEQPPQFHPEGDVWQHTIAMLRAMRAPSSALAWSVLLHDVGKPVTYEVNAEGIPRFPNHARVGCELAKDILTRLRAPNALIQTVSEAIRWHMSFADVPRMRAATLRRMLARDTFGLELELHRLDCFCSHKKMDHYVFLLDQLGEYEDEPILPPPFLSGHDVIAAGIPAGKRVGEILRKAQDAQLNGLLESRKDALEWLAEIAGEEEGSST